MANQSLTSPPSILVCDPNSNYHHSRPSFKSPSHNICAEAVSSSGAMAIRSVNDNSVPPPLPPPRHIADLEHGHDQGWKWGNRSEEGELGQNILAPIKPNSSLHGGHIRPEFGRRDEKFSVDDVGKRRNGMPSTKFTLEGKLKTEPSQSWEEGYPNSLASNMSSSLIGHALSHMNVERSPYDQQILSKIGKPSSPPRKLSGLGNSIDKKITVANLPFHSKGPAMLSTLSTDDGSLSPRDPVSRWSSGTQSAGISPIVRKGWGDHGSYRSPSVDNIMTSVIDPDHLSHSRDRQVGAGTSHVVHETVSLPSRSNRGSYDQGVFPDSDLDFPMEDAGHPRQFNGEERAPSHLDGMSPLSRLGVKRRASSPPRQATCDETHLLPTATTNGDHDQRRTAGFTFTTSTSPNARFQPNYGSVSTVSSASLRTGSYASSSGLSAGSSMTSVSSFDRHSPGGISPTSDLETCYEKGIVSPSSHKPMSSISASRAQHHREPIGVKNTPGARKMTVQTALTISKPAPPRIGRSYICECCPKKPKKFDSLEELRAHQMEKQYTCQFCNKRFKNKNEAERHQNSLHLRRHSWSCAALSCYEAAFHPSASPNCQTPTGPSHDTCGYCGDEFPNYPQPEWDRRIDHLTNVHKFGECNQSKKFYRADHFRQHLKHSHAGASGKWTNILENACMKEEELASIGEQGSRSPENSIAGESTNADNVSGSTVGTLNCHTIDEMEES